MPPSPTLADQTVSIQPLEPVNRCNAQAAAISTDINTARATTTDIITIPLAVSKGITPPLVMQLRPRRQKSFRQQTKFRKICAAVKLIDQLPRICRSPKG